MKMMSFIRNKFFLPGLPRGEASGERGFTLVELIVSMAITAVVTISLYGIYNSFTKRVNIQDQVQESLQNARAGLSFMERELLNAGLASGSAEALTEATANSIEFVYTDPETDGALSTTAGLRIRVKYGLETLSGIQYLYRSVAICADTLCTATSGSNEPIISYVNDLAITYFSSQGVELFPTTTAIRADVRFATIILKTTTKDILPGMTAPKIFTVKTHLRIRNLGIGTTATDTVAPDAPTIVAVRDPRECSSLKVRWNASTSGDVAGYKIYYGTVSGVYVGVIDVPITSLSGDTYSCTKSGGFYECTITPDLPTLTYSPSDGTADTMYYLMVKTYDNSFNNSAASSVASGNPSTSVSDFADSGDDSTINPIKPGVIVNFIGSDGVGDNQVSFTWDTYDTSAYPDVTGMRLYRSTSAMTTYPIDPSDPDIDWIAGEPSTGRASDISVGDTSFTDASASLLGCQTYYYAMAPVNCDTTLITDGDDIENGDYTRYIVSDYAVTYGDGPSGGGSDTPSGADTTPAETTAPDAPLFDVRAGWKRVALALKQPTNTDFARSCIYVNESANYPELQTNTELYPLSGGCLQINTSLTPAARLIPDSDGIFTVEELGLGSSIGFYHDSMTVETPGPPALSEDGTFSYRSVALDYCGNASGIAEAQAVTVLCGEDPKVSDYTINTFNHPKPPAVTVPTVSVCSGKSTVDWAEVSSDAAFASTPTNPYDLAGYRIIRSTTSDFSSDISLLNSGAPFWGNSYGDNDILTDGLAYYYRIATTDCVYEAVDPVDATIIGDAASNYLHSIDATVVYPGKIFRDEKCEGVGVCTQDNHREVLTGVDMDNADGSGDGTSTPQSSFNHDKVTLFFENTSGSTFTIQQLSIYWVNTGANLSNVKIGGGRGGLAEISTAIDIDDSVDDTTYSPQLRAVINKNIADVEIPGNARYVPIELTFTDSDGKPVDMREDKLLIDLAIQNDSSLLATCTSNLTISEVLESISVPFGPSISATQQDRPTSPTFGYPVPGATGLNTVPSGGDADLLIVGNIDINIKALIKSNTTSGETGAKIALNAPVLHYIATARTVIEAPTSGYTAVTMSDTGGGIYTGAIEANDGLRLWYYIVATDADGNFDRDPEIAAGAYSYDQDTYVFDVCDLTPSAPPKLSATDNGANVDMVWLAPSTYTDGSPIDTGLDSLTYEIYRDGDVTPIATVSDPTLVYTDLDPAVAPASGVFSYNVSVKNSCLTPGPNESAWSATSSVCVGGSGDGLMSLDKTSILQGESFTVTITDCNALAGVYALSLDVLNGGDFDFFTVENTVGDTITPTDIFETSAASGTFVATINTTGDVDVSMPSPMIYTTATGSGDLTVAYDWAGNSPLTINVSLDPCDSTPSTPTGLSGVMSGNGGNETATLSWNEVTTNDDSSTITDLVGYYVYEKVCPKNTSNCSGGDIIADWFVRAAIAADATPSTPALSGDNGNYNNRIYYFKVVAYDSCGTPNESAASTIFTDPS